MLAQSFHLKIDGVFNSDSIAVRQTQVRIMFTDPSVLLKGKFITIFEWEVLIILHT